MSKHTSGPWKVRGTCMVVGGNPEFLVCDCACDRDKRKEDIDNARLIAAAPELLNTLITLVAAGNLCIEDKVLAEQAIAKATGE